MCGIICTKQQPSKYASLFGFFGGKPTVPPAPPAAAKPAALGDIQASANKLVKPGGNLPPKSRPPQPPSPPSASGSPRPATLPRIPEATKMAAQRLQNLANRGKTYDPKTRSYL